MEIDLPEKRYYSIGELAKAFQVNTSLIRFWEKEFDVLKPKKNAKGNRMFTPEDLSNLKTIYHLVKEKGFTLEGAKEHLKKSKTKPLDQLEIIQKLEIIKTKLINLKTNFNLKSLVIYEKMVTTCWDYSINSNSYRKFLQRFSRIKSRCTNRLVECRKQLSKK